MVDFQELAFLAAIEAFYRMHSKKQDRIAFAAEWPAIYG